MEKNLKNNIYNIYFLRFFSIIGYYKILNMSKVPCLCDTLGICVFFLTSLLEYNCFTLLC